MTLLSDIFSETISKVKQLGMWERLTNSQKESIVSKYILDHYNKNVIQEKTPSAVLKR